MVTHFSEHAPGTVFRAIADPTRRTILEGLAAGERTAGEIAGDFDISRPAVSKHLRLLGEAGLVRVERVGRERRYRADARPLDEVERWVTRHRQAWARRLVDLKEHAESLAKEAGPNPERDGPAPTPDPAGDQA